MHQVDELLHPQYRLQRVGGFEDGSDGLTFARLVSEIQPMILLCLVLVRCSDGAARGHVIVIDMWRSLVFLGAGDPDDETLVGVKGITAEDREGDRGLDQAMEALGVTRLQAVRALWEHVPSLVAKRTRIAFGGRGEIGQDAKCSSRALEVTAAKVVEKCACEGHVLA